MQDAGKVLVVSAEPILGASICAAMTRHGLAGVHASDAADAVHRLADMGPAAVVVDLLFPEMDPQQLVRRALACRETHGSPVVLLATPEGETDRDGWLAAGCAAVLPRTTAALEVASAVRRALQQP